MAPMGDPCVPDVIGVNRITHRIRPIRADREAVSHVASRHTRCYLSRQAKAGGDDVVPPTDDDQTSEREDRVDEIMKNYRRDHPPESQSPLDGDRDHPSDRNDGGGVRS